MLHNMSYEDDIVRVFERQQGECELVVCCGGVDNSVLLLPLGLLCTATFTTALLLPVLP